ncbi:hypothetical protein NLM27_04630 [Bradyrhizobium sp. CCGB12]|uniref:hypothetical protein n=1 Tax=Bradyrhizobium sp. CCGB12 TaxID=2949632 RepID=UPI0020B3A332|nr:hypothetical protein [Bradyrhizobium sp. CCGB12]MCP3388062.1 hypothetical protein [Bradyrhizobium sp. CCGB12]
MGDIIRLVPKSELERIRLIQEARAIYDSIFPPNAMVGEEPCPTQSAQSAFDSLGNSVPERE